MILAHAIPRVHRSTLRRAVWYMEETEGRRWGRCSMKINDMTIQGIAKGLALISFE